MKILPVESSSSGNSTLIFNDDTHILIDCGVSAKKVFERTGRKEFDALFISHEHGDHVSGAGPLGRKSKVPIYMHEAVYKHHEGNLGNCTINYIDETSEITVGSFIIKPFSTKHDARHSLGFVVEEPATGDKLCYLTDTGNISRTIKEKTKDCNVFFIECDYDEELIKDYDGYSQDLKDRITSNFGHLSTSQALDYLSTYNLDDVKAVIIGHISPRTNSPEKVMERVQEKVASYKDKFKLAPFEQALVI